jgi:UDP-N-acetylglucosamine 4,6-dehydratase (inverting)
MLQGKCVLVTGGTGSFGKAFARTLLAPEVGLRRLVIYSRDELKQFEMSEDPVFKDRRVRFFLGDVRDKPRLDRAMEGVDVVVHAAALKQVPAAESNPFEVIKTNILGAQNVIESALDSPVEHVVALSTDKAAAPINLYGATKLCSDKLFVAANHFKGSRKLKLGVVRYGNVIGSRGSVIPYFLKKRSEGVLPITDPSMTRFNITLSEGIALVLFALENMWGGEIYVPKIPSYRILDVAKAIAPNARLDVVGVRPGEKLHEEMITASDSLQTLEFQRHYVILPSMPLWDVEQYLHQNGGKRCEAGFSYDSGKNTEWLTIEQLRELVRKHVDPSFVPDSGATPS